MSPDALAKQAKPAKIVDVKDAMSLKDGTVEINLYNIPNPACRRHAHWLRGRPEPGVGHGT